MADLTDVGMIGLKPSKPTPEESKLYNEIFKRGEAELLPASDEQVLKSSGKLLDAEYKSLEKEFKNKLEVDNLMDEVNKTLNPLNLAQGGNLKAIAKEIGMDDATLAKYDDLMSEAEMLEYKANVLDVEYGPEESEVMYRKLVNSNQSLAQNAYDDTTEIMYGLFVGLPAGVLRSAAGAAKAAYRASDSDLTMKERVRASEAVGAHLNQLPEAFVSGYASGIKQLLRGSTGFREAPIETLLTVLPIGALAKASARAAKRGAALSRTKAARSKPMYRQQADDAPAPTDSRMATAAEKTQALDEAGGRITAKKPTIAEDAGQVWREFYDTYAQSSSLNLADNSLKLLKQIDNRPKTSAAVGALIGAGLGGVPGAVAGAAGTLTLSKVASAPIIRLAFDESYKINDKTYKDLNDVPVEATKTFYKEMNKMNDISGLSDAQLAVLDKALTSGFQTGPHRAAYSAIELIGNITKILDDVEAAEKAGIEKTRNKLYGELEATKERLGNLIDDIDSKLPEQTPEMATQEIFARENAQRILNEKIAEEASATAKPSASTTNQFSKLKQDEAAQAKRQIVIDEARAKVEQLKENQPLDASQIKDGVLQPEIQPRDPRAFRLKDETIASLSEDLKKIFPKRKSEVEGFEKITGKAVTKMKDDFLGKLDVDAAKGGYKNIAEYMAMNENPLMTFLHDGKPIDNVSFFFEMSDDASRIDPAKFEVVARTPEAKELADAALAVRRGITEVSKKYRGINTGTAAKPVPFLPETVYVANVPHYRHMGSRRQAFDVKGKRKQLEEGFDVKEDIRDAAPDVRAVSQPTVADLNRQKVFARTGATDAQKAAYGIQMGKDFVDSMANGMYKTANTGEFYRFANDLYKEAGNPSGLPASQRWLFKDKKEFDSANKAVPGGLKKSDYVIVPTTYLDEAGRTLYGPLSGTVMRRAEFNLINNKSKLDNLYAALSDMIALSSDTWANALGKKTRVSLPTKRTNNLFDKAVDKYKGANNWVKAINTVANPVYFANTTKGYSDLLMLEGINPAEMFKGMAKNKQRDFIAQAMLETGHFRPSAMMVGALENIGLTPANLGLNPAKYAKKTFQNNVVDAKAMMDIWKDIVKAKDRNDMSVLEKMQDNKNALSKGAGQTIKMVSEVVGESPQFLMEAFTLGGFNSALAAFIDLGARRTMFESILKGEAKRRGVTLKDIVNDKKFLDAAARQTNKKMISYDNMPWLHRKINEYSPFDPYHNWYVGSLRRFLDYATDKPLVSTAARSAGEMEKNQRSEFFKNIQRNMSERERGMIAQLPLEDKNLYLSLAYASVFEPSIVDPVKMATLGILLEPTTMQHKMLRRFNSKKISDAIDEGNTGEAINAAIRAMRDEGMATVNLTDSGIWRFVNALRGKRANFDPTVEKTTDAVEIMKDGGAALLPTVYGFYVGSETASFFDEDFQKEQIAKTGERRSRVLNLTPSELLFRSLGFRIQRNRPNLEGYFDPQVAKAKERILNEIGAEYDADIEKATTLKLEERKMALEAAKLKAVMQLDSVANDLMTRYEKNPTGN